MLTGKRLDDHVRKVSSRLTEELAAVIAKQDDVDTFALQIGNALQSCLDELSKSECWGQANQIPSSLLWNANRELLERGSLQSHARTKPLGYAGDFQLLDRICRKDVTDDPIGNPMDWFFQAQAAPRAVRNRYRLIADRIVEKFTNFDRPVRTASIGSGPAWELNCVLEQIEEASFSLEATLVDIDPRSLAFCKENLANAKSTKVQTIQANLGRLARLKKVLAELNGTDFVYCAGYFDYLDDEAAIAMLRTLWEQVADGGELLVFNFNQHNPSRAYMEWFGNWYLVYRTTDSLGRLCEAANLPGATTEVGAEPAGVNLFLKCVKR